MTGSWVMGGQHIHETGQDVSRCSIVQYDIIVHCTMCNMILVKIQYWYFPGQYCDKYQYRYDVPEQVPNLSSPPAHRRPKPSDYVVVCAGSSSCCHAIFQELTQVVIRATSDVKETFGRGRSSRDSGAPRY